MARVYIAVALTEPSARNSAFAAIHVILNVSGALGPIIANLLVGYGWSKALLVGIALGYLVSAVVVALTVPADLHPGSGDERRVTAGVFRTMLRDPAVRRLSVITAAGGFLYAQFFSALSLHITQVSDSPAVRASFFTANAVLVVVLQIPASAYTNRGLQNGIPPIRYLITGIGLFALAFGLLAVAADFVLVGTYLAVALFSLAETFFTPLVNTAYADVSAGLPTVEAFTMRQIAATAGESLGAFADATFFLEATERHVQPVYWLFVALIGAGVIVLHRIRGGAGRHRQPQDSH
jgi:DHA1 family multidrug resistance protein-like MFS transporter